MGDTTLHTGVLAQWFKVLLLLLFLRYGTVVVSGILLVHFNL